MTENLALAGLKRFRQAMGQRNTLDGPEVEQLLQELEHHMRSAYQSQAEVARLENVVLSKTAENNGQQHEMAAMLDEVRRRDSTIECLQEANRVYNQSVTLEGKDELPEERDALVAMIFSLRGDRKRLEGELGAVKGELLNAQQEADDAKERFSMVNDDFVSARKTNEKLLAKIEEHEKFRQMALKSQDLQAAHERIASLERETRDQQTKLEAALDRASSLQRSLHEATSPLAGAPSNLPPMRHDPQPPAEPLAIDTIKDPSEIRPTDLGDGELPPPPAGAPPWSNPVSPSAEQPPATPEKPSGEGNPLTSWG